MTLMPLPDEILAELSDRLPGDACCFTVAEGAPGIVICHQGRALGLQVKTDRLSAEQCAVFNRLRTAGMRIEIARSLQEALALVREMGVSLKNPLQPL